MKHHEFASLFPMLPDAELQALADDIKENGLQTPITTLDDQILDGRNRHRACEIAGVLPNFQRFVGKDPLAFVLSHNLHRRHLNEAQRAMVAGKVANLKFGDNQHREGVGIPIPKAAEMLNVSRDSVTQARKIFKDGVPELAEAVMSGTVSLAAAVDVAKLPDTEQSALVEKGKDALKQAAKELREVEAKRPSTPAPTTKRIVVPKIGIGIDRAERAICWLEEISDEDPQRAEALTRVIGWCQEQLNKTP